MNAKHTPLVNREHPACMGGEQRVFRFANGYGASVVRFRGSYGHQSGFFELAVIEFTGPDADDFNLVYDTPITDDVIGWLSEDAVQETLDEIQALPSKVPA